MSRPRKKHRTHGLLAASLVAVGSLMAVPAGPMSAEELRESRTEQQLEITRQELAQAVMAYRLDHGQLPGISMDWTEEALSERFERQLTFATNAEGDFMPVSEPDYPYGPYLPSGLPINPVSGDSTVRLSQHGLEPQGTAGWVVDMTSGEVASDAIQEETP